MNRHTNQLDVIKDVLNGKEVEWVYNAHYHCYAVFTPVTGGVEVDVRDHEGEYVIPVGADPDKYKGGFNEQIFQVLRVAREADRALGAIPWGTLVHMGGPSKLIEALLLADEAARYVRLAHIQKFRLITGAEVGV